MDEKDNIGINVNKINDKHDDDMDVDNSNNLLSNNSKSSTTKNKISSNETTITITKQNKDSFQEIKKKLQLNNVDYSSNNNYYYINTEILFDQYGYQC